MDKYPSPLYCWQVLKGAPEWWFQTDRPKIKNKMRRRTGFREITLFSHPPLWIFEKSFTRKASAVRCMESLTGFKAAWNEEKALYGADTKTSAVKQGSSPPLLLNGKRNAPETAKGGENCTPSVDKKEVCNCDQTCNPCVCAIGGKL